MPSDRHLKQLINDMADTIRSIFQVKGPIDEIDKVVKKMGGRVVEDSSIDGFSDGRIRKEGKDSFVIEISPFQSKERRNFTIAHELGHLFLHMGFMTNPEIWESPDNVTYYRNGSSELEYQANEFAAAFLMPKRDYELRLYQCLQGDFVDTSQIASYFHVSIDAAATRGKWLGYLKW